MPYFGNGKISGKTRIEGVNTDGVPVDLLDRNTGSIAHTVNSSGGGNFMFDNLYMDHLYDVIARPPLKNAVISDTRIPVAGIRPDFTTYVAGIPSVRRHFRMNDTSSVATDSIGSTSGTYQGAATVGGVSLLPQDSGSGSAALTGGYVTIPATASEMSFVNETHIFTVAPNSTGSRATIFHKGDYGVSGGQGVACIITVDGEVSFAYFNAGWREVKTLPLGLPSLYMLAIRFNGDQTIDVFVNGTPVRGGILPVPFIVPNTPMRIGSGTVNGTPMEPFLGSVGNYIQVGAALSDVEIASIYRLGFVA